MSGGRRWVLLAIAVVALAITIATSARDLTRAASDGPITNPTDFRAFYCGGRALLSGADPYRVEPLSSCEHGVVAAEGFRMQPGMVLPAPLPPYALAFFAMFALLPFGTASLLWFGVGILTFGITVILVQRLTSLPVVGVAAALFAADAYASLVIGQLVPLVLCLLCAAAVALRARRARLAALCVAAAMIEPHVALPAALGLLVLAPRARRALYACAIVLFAVTVLVVPVSTVVEYVTSVLPLHALSEVEQFNLQYSLTALADLLGAADASAVHLGEASYVFMLALGLYGAARLMRREDDPAYAVLVPPALALFGGVFVHIHQMAIALPFALLAFARMPRLRPVLLVAIVGLAVPWETIVEIPALSNALWGAPRAVASVPIEPSDANELAERAEMRALDAGTFFPPSRTIAQTFALKAPTWIGLAIVTLVAVGPLGVTARARRVSIV